MIAGTRRWVNPWHAVTGRRLSPWHRLTPPQLFVGSFLALIVLGTLGLKTLPGLYTGAPLGWTDAAFTATSAVCITGLVVVDTATYFTPAGQAFLLLLFQLGGLGMITFTTLIILALGRRLSLRQERLHASVAEVAPHIRVDRLTRSVVRFTLLFEGAGALLLYALWAPRFGWVEAVWPAVFHAVSAFCNAGFTIFSDSLIGFQRAPATLTVVTALVVVGGLGFLTMEEGYQWRCARRDRRQFRLSVHSRLVLVTTAVLLLGGWVLFGLFEWGVTLRELAIPHRVANALVMSAMPRSGGFHSVDYAHATDSSNFLSIILMFIGGSPGSTAGGLKTTTVALLALLAWSRFQGREVVHAGARSIPEETIQRAIGLAVTGFAAVTASIFLYTWLEHSGPTSERGQFLTYMFEAVSAFNTVGLSMGATPTLSAPGRWLSVLLMFAGRVGPLTLAAALAVSARRRDARFRYAYEDVVVG